jgi:hypothetical protein
VRNLGNGPSVAAVMILIVVIAFLFDAAFGSYFSQHPFLQSFVATLLGVFAGGLLALWGRRSVAP